MSGSGLTHLQQLESESIHIIRETVAECDRPVMLYSVGKDSAVMLHLACKAFAPGRLPFPLMHVDTTFKFAEMIQFRDEMVRKVQAELIVHRNEEALAQTADPKDWDCTKCASLLKTHALREGLAVHGFDAAFGGARRDEEKSRAKERIVSVRHNETWDPKNQRPELWSLYNLRRTVEQTFRVFPLSNWTELDIWNYIYRESIPIVPLYFAARREVIRRDGMLLLAGQLNQIREGEATETMMVRFRTLGCQLCTGAVQSKATTLEQIIAETALATNSERENRAVDQDREGSMEEKKREGYF
ncbi:MAG: sulfate adenylyltransferase subunit CysD [bacterium]|nr:sulfate adenylyltransferase subunit CysD [bacterium]